MLSLHFTEYDYRHAKTILEEEHSEELKEIKYILRNLPKFRHGAKQQTTPADKLANEFRLNGWTREYPIELSSSKKDTVDLFKNRIAIEQEYSRFEAFFRDFFRLMLLYDERTIDVGVIITYSPEAFEDWQGRFVRTGTVQSYRASRASLHRLRDFLEGKYKTIVRIPIYCIGIE
jgi:hypothetical protein